VLDEPIFPHEKLKVYRRALAFFRFAEAVAGQWESKHAIAGHLPRAAESIVVRIAEANAGIAGNKHKALDYAMGSTLECAACLDIGAAKELIDRPTCADQKECLTHIFRMQMGLRKSWSRANVVREEGESYGRQTPRENETGFHHEQLDVYRVALKFACWFCGPRVSPRLTARRFREMDAATTSTLLNIAEGNGRFSVLDQRSFWEVAHRSAIKMAAQLELCVSEEMLARRDVDDGKRLLVRVASMTSVMARGKGSAGE
jgi:four helix bundle protein